MHKICVLTNDEPFLIYNLLILRILQISDYLDVSNVRNEII